MVLLGLGFRQTLKWSMPPEWFGDLPHTHVALDDAKGQGALLCKMLAARVRWAEGRGGAAVTEV